MHDDKLLKEYAEGKSDAAFTRIVERHLNFVYTVCRRELGNPQLAEDATQIVFLSLARRASSLRRDVVLAGWLFTASRMACANLRRQEMRRKRYEENAVREAAVMREPISDEWNDMEPRLQDALSSLKENDRNAILLRFFEGMSLRETGEALGSSEDAARVRVNRAVDKMRRYFVKHGVSLSGVTMTASLAERAVDAAPMSPNSIVQSINAATAAGATSSIAAGSTGVLRMFWITKAKSVLAGAAFTTCCWGAAAFAGTHSRSQFRFEAQHESNTGPVDGIVQTESGAPVTGVKVLMQKGMAIRRMNESMITWTGPWRRVSKNGIDITPTIEYETTTTDQDGRFHFDHANAMQVLVNADGFGAGGSSISFRPGPQLFSDSMNIVLSPPAELHLHYVDQRGNPIKGLTVQPAFLTDHHSSFQPPSTWKQITSEDGSVTFTGLPQGADITIDTNSDIYGHAQSRYKIDGAITEIPPVHLDRAGTISGVVTFADTGLPAANVELNVSMPNMPGVTTRTDQSGHYTAAPIPAGEYHIAPMLLSPGADMWTAPDAVRSVSGGESVMGVDIKLIKGSVISGLVTYSDTHKAAANVSVNIGAIEDNADNGLTMLTTDSEGRFHYRTPARKIYIQAGSVDPANTQRQFVTATDGKDQTVSIEIPRPIASAMVKGTVLDPTGKPAVNADVVAFPTTNVQSMSTRTDANGKFSLLITGSRLVNVRARLGSNATTEACLALAGADDVTLRLVDNTLGSMSGKVLGSDGRALAGISVTAVQWNANLGEHVAQATTDANGRYRFGGLWPGLPYNTSIEAEGFGPTMSSGAQITPGKDVTINPVTLSKTDSYVAGQVLNSHGLPAAGAHVAWMDENSHNTIADAQGRFRLNGVTGGKVSLMVGAGSESAYRDVQANRDDIVVRTQPR